jgi:CDP-paratose 2-epimerase
MTRVLVTGGAGFVGASVGLELARRHPEWDLIALDNLHRRGSELNLPRLREGGVRFVEGDVRDLDRLLALDPIDKLIECSAEPSVLATQGDVPYAVGTNLLGAHLCLELARRDGAQVVFLSTSRVYPIAPLNDSVRLVEAETRFELVAEQELAGVSERGISERFPLDGARTIYGATKLAAELLIEEYAQGFGLECVVDRCGVIGGPWQMGKVDQGVFTHWVLSHRLGRELTYIGYGGTGKQVRDVLHVDDLVELIDQQLAEPERWAGVTVNVGGGRESSLSLLEATELCRELSGTELPIGSTAENRPGDVPLYISDCTRLFDLTAWRPQRGARDVLVDTYAWADQHADLVAAAIDGPRGG